jgi:hypothetical protein
MLLGHWQKLFACLVELSRSDVHPHMTLMMMN